jgi:hypothetical protein
MTKTHAEKIEFLNRAVAAFTKQGDAVMVAYAKKLLTEDAPSTSELINEAGVLNSGKLANVDHVSIMGLMDHAEMVVHVAKLRQLAA